MSYWGNRKPTIGSAIDWGHPLSQGLVAAFAFNEGGGTNLVDAVSGFQVPFGSTPSWSQAGGLVTNAGHQRASIKASDRYKINGRLTLVWKGMRVGTPAGYGGLFGVRYNSTNTSPYNSYVISHDSTATKFAFLISNSLNNNFELDTTFTLSNGIPYLLVASVDPNKSINSTNDIFLYALSPQNGIQGTTGSITFGMGNNLISYTSSSYLYFGDYNDLNSNPNVRHELALIYNRTFTKSDVEWISAEPYAMWLGPHAMKMMFLGVRTAGFFDPVGVGGGPVGKQASLVK